MTARIEEIKSLSSSHVRFYSIRLGMETVSEFEKFDTKFYEEKETLKELQIIYQTIKQISLRGAKENFFRPEGPAFALPGKVSKEDQKKNRKNYGLRLYVVLVDFNTVILLNGGIKTHIDPSQCPNVRNHFIRAQHFAVQLKKAVQNDFVRFTLEYGMEADDDDFTVDI